MPKAEANKAKIMKPIEAIFCGVLFLVSCCLLYRSRGVKGLCFLGLIVLTVSIFTAVEYYFGTLPAFVAIVPLFVVAIRLASRWGWNR